MQAILSAHEFKKFGFFVFKVMYDKIINIEISVSHFELVSIFYYRAKSIFWVKQVVQTNLSFPILSWSVKLIHNSSNSGKLAFS